MRSFRSALRNGQDAERRWVDDLRTLGRAVCHGKKIRVKKHCRKTGHVETPDALALVSVEVKERSLAFTCPEDYPYDTVFVDDCRGLGMEPYKNLVYIYRSKPTQKWVWLTMLDRNEEWTEEVTFDRGRGHEVPVLVAPKRFLRPAEQLVDLIYPHCYLDLVDGDTDCFLSGGGEVEERERYVAKAPAGIDPGTGAPAAKDGKHMG